MRELMIVTREVSGSERHMLTRMCGGERVVNHVTACLGVYSGMQMKWTVVAVGHEVIGP